MIKIIKRDASYLLEQAIGKIPDCSIMVNFGENKNFLQKNDDFVPHTQKLI